MNNQNHRNTNIIKIGEDNLKENYQLELVGKTNKKKQ